MRSSFDRRKRFVSPVLTLILLAGAASLGSASQPRCAKPSTARVAVDFFGQCLDILRQYDKASKRLADPPQSMLVRVVDADGKPVAGALVVATDVAKVEHRSNINVPADSWANVFGHLALTNAKGTGRVLRPASKEGGFVIFVTAREYMSAATQWSIEQGQPRETIPSEFTFKLDRGQVIGGVVRDAAGRPIAGAHLQLNFSTEEALTDRVQSLDNNWCGETNSQGRWQSSRLRSRLDGLTINIQCKGYVPQYVNEAACKMQFEDLRTQKAILVMAKGLVVQGRVTDSQGKPLPSAKVGITEQTGSLDTTYNQQWTNGEGRYRFDQCMAGTAVVSVAAKGLASRHRAIEIAAKTPPVDFRLKAGRAVKIRVLDPRGNPLAGVRIEPGDLTSFSPSLGGNPQEIVASDSPTDRDGRWTSESEPEGKISLTIEMPYEMTVDTLQTPTPPYATIHRTFAAGDEEHVVPMHPPVRVMGRIINASTRQPIRKVNLKVKGIPLIKEPGAYTWPCVEADGEGRYTATFNDELGVDRMAWQLCRRRPAT